MPTPPPPITPVPTPAPQRGDRTTFSGRVDAFVTWLTNATAEFQAVADNVYNNAFIAEGSGNVATVGLGITTDSPHLTNIDNAAAISAFWTVDGTTAGTFPTGGARTGMVINKIYGTNGFQMFQPSGAGELWYRRRSASAWQAWVKLPDQTSVDAKLPLAGGVMTGDLQMNSASPTMYFSENDQAGAAGKWRWIFNNNAWAFQKNTATAGDYSTVATPFSADTGGTGVVNGAVPVQQGTGTGQGANTVKIGWATGGGGLKVTVDLTDQGYIPFVTTNPGTGSSVQFNGPNSFKFGNTADFATIGYNGSGAVSMMRLGSVTGQGGMIHRYDRASGIYYIGNGTAGSETDRVRLDPVGTLNALNGFEVTGAYTSIQGGSLATLANNGFKQIGTSSGLNVVYDYAQIQARNNGAATTLNLNPLGGTVQVGSGGVSTGGNVTAGSLNVSGMIFAQGSGGNKIQLMTGGTTNGWIQANATQPFVAVNAANTLQVFYSDNSGNFTAAANITAYSDERLKTNWRDLPDDFLERLADVKHGIYDRIDVEETQAGLSAQGIQKICPELVIVDEKGLLTLNYGALGGLAALRLARRVREQQNEIDGLKAAVSALIKKVGAP